ncbi:MAG: ASCH domain-containing protein [Proteobacteria bacterium]|nr:ASCH domain-containing protein [Pseudomonadota bacterium]
MDKPRSPEVEAFWNAYRVARGLPEQDYDVCRFGSSPEMGDELLALVLEGRKRATACLLRDIEIGGEKMGRVGGHVVVLDGGDRPRAIWRTRTIDVKPLNQVDSAFAWDEGEGDRTRADWLAMHVRYFTARAEAEGFSFDESMPAVFERFSLVWPPEHADPQSAA